MKNARKKKTAPTKKTVHAKKRAAAKKTVHAKKRAGAKKTAKAKAPSTSAAPLQQQPQSKLQAATQAGVFLHTDDAWALAYFSPNDLHCEERELFA